MRSKVRLVVIGVTTTLVVGVIALAVSRSSTEPTEGAAAPTTVLADSAGNESLTGTTRPSVGVTTTMVHTFDPAYVGDVWIEVDPPDAGPHEVVITWGKWQRVILHRGEATRTYAFKKGFDPNQTESPPVAVGAPDDVVVVVGQGGLPPDAVAINEGWIELETPVAVVRTTGSGPSN